MRTLILALALGFVIASGAIAGDLAQLVDLTVTDGYNLSTFYVFNGTVGLAAPAQPGAANMAKITVFVGNFSTVVTPEGKWAISVPKPAILAPGRDPQHIFIVFRAIQHGQNVMVEKTYKLADLMHMFKQLGSFKELHQN